MLSSARIVMLPELSVIPALMLISDSEPLASSRRFPLPGRLIPVPVSKTVIEPASATIMAEPLLSSLPVRTLSIAISPPAANSVIRMSPVVPPVCISRIPIATSRSSSDVPAPVITARISSLPAITFAVSPSKSSVIAPCSAINATSPKAPALISPTRILPALDHKVI